MAWHIRPISEFATHADEWQALNRACSDTPLLDRRFVEPLLREFSSGREVVASFRQDESLLSMGIFTRTNRFTYQTLQPSNAPLGLWLCRPSLPVADLLDSLTRSLSPFCLMVGITQQDPDISSRPAPSSRLVTLDYIQTARITVPGSFEAYWRARSKNLRHDVSRQKNRLQRDGVSARLRTLTTKDDMARAVADYSRLETAGWKGAIDSAVEANSPQGRFYTAMLGSFAEIGEAFVCQYLLDGSVVATDLCLRRRDNLFILKTAYREGRRGISPAHLMRHDLFADVFDDGTLRTVEFYGRVMDWHRRLTDEVRTMYHINYYRWPFLASLHRRPTL
jgi:hypothetical protein